MSSERAEVLPEREYTEAVPASWEERSAAEVPEQPSAYGMGEGREAHGHSAATSGDEDSGCTRTPSEEVHDRKAAISGGEGA
eukprot:6463756-Alexandrium_andersonii.AAC.1